MRCPDCNKFVGMDAETEPEVNIDVDSEGNVTGDVRIVNVCTECGAELKEANLDIDADVAAEVLAHVTSCHDDGESFNLSVEEVGSSRTQRTEGRGRGQRTFYGYSVEFRVTCDCGRDTDGDGSRVDGTFTVDGSASDDIQASAMEEIA
jgi:hypothetical protein